MANEITGQQVLVEDGINIQVVSEDGRINLSSNGAGRSQQVMSIDRQAVSAMSAVSAGTVSICFLAQRPEGEFLDVKKMLTVDTGWAPVFRPTVLETAQVLIDKIPMFPVDLAVEAIDIAVTALDGTILVASTMPDGTFTGDVDPAFTSMYDATTGSVNVTFTKVLQFGQLVTVRKRFPVTMAPDLEVDVSDLLPFTIEKNCHFILKPDKPYLAGSPVAPNTLEMISLTPDGKRVSIKDDGAGKLVGDVGITGVNTIDYTSGEVQLLLNKDIHGVLTARWGVYKEVIEYQPTTLKEDEKVRVRVDIDWQDIHRIVMSMRQAAAAAEQNVKYRVDV